MSELIIEDPAWKAIMSDPALQRARSRLSFDEIRTIVRHASLAAEAKSARLVEALENISGLLCEHQIYRVECCPPCIARAALTLPEPSHEPTKGERA